MSKVFAALAFLAMAATSVGALALALAAYNGLSALNAIFG